LACGFLTLCFAEVLTEFAGDETAVGLYGYVTRHIDQVAVFDAAFVDAFRGGQDGQGQTHVR